MKKFEIGSFVRPTSTTTEINTIDIVELLKLAGADGLMPRQTQFGTKVFLCKGTDTLKVSAIRIGDKANLPTGGHAALTGPHQAAALKELINNNEVYWGESTNGHWLCFSRKGTLVPGVVTSFADIMAATGMSEADLKQVS